MAAKEMDLVEQYVFRFAISSPDSSLQASFPCKMFIAGIAVKTCVDCTVITCQENFVNGCQTEHLVRGYSFLSVFNQQISQYNSPSYEVSLSR